MKFPKLTEGQQLVMKCVWMRLDDLSLQEIVSLANQTYQKNWKPQTVSTFLSQLVKKEYLQLYKEGRTYKYHALVKEEEYSGSLLKEHIRFWNNNNVKSFAMNLYKDEAMTKEQIRHLKQLLEEFEE